MTARKTNPSISHGLRGVTEQQSDSLHGIECFQNLGRLQDAVDSEERDRHEPAEHDWSKEFSDALGAVLLDQKQAHEDCDADRYDEGGESRL